MKLLTVGSEELSSESGVEDLELTPCLYCLKSLTRTKVFLDSCKLEFLEKLGLNDVCELAFFLHVHI